MISKGTVLGSRWIVHDLVGEGACGKVYSVNLKDSTDSTITLDLVAKVIPLAHGKGKKAKEQERICNTLNFEYMLYTGVLADFPYRPELPERYYGNDSNYGVRYLVMERLERDLLAFATHSSTSPPDSSSIAFHGLQILDGLTWLHRRGYLFIDVKPENFMLKGNKLYFVDYGLMTRYVTYDSSNAKAPASNVGFEGTPTFCSLSVHNGTEATRNDDIESMAFVLLSLRTRGLLPWSTAKSHEEGLKMKSECDVTQFSFDLDCPEIGEIIKESRLNTYSQPPNYNRYKELLTQMKDRKNTSNSTKEVKLKSSTKAPVKSTSNPSDSLNNAQSETIGNNNNNNNKPLKSSKTIAVSKSSSLINNHDSNNDTKILNDPLNSIIFAKENFVNNTKIGMSPFIDLTQTNHNNSVFMSGLFTSTSANTRGGVKRGSGQLFSPILESDKRLSTNSSTINITSNISELMNEQTSHEKIKNNKKQLNQQKSLKKSIDSSTIFSNNSNTNKNNNTNNNDNNNDFMLHVMSGAHVGEKILIGDKSCHNIIIKEIGRNENCDISFPRDDYISE
eukprot:gene12205-16349_t